MMTTTSISTARKRLKYQTICGKVMPRKREAKKLFHWRRVQCDLEPDHMGDHVAHTNIGTFTWWNPRG